MVSDFFSPKKVIFSITLRRLSVNYCLLIYISLFKCISQLALTPPRNSSFCKFYTMNVTVSKLRHPWCSGFSGHVRWLGRSRPQYSKGQDPRHVDEAVLPIPEAPGKLRERLHRSPQIPPGLVRRWGTPSVLDLWLLLYPGFLDWCSAELCQEVHHPYWLAGLWLRDSGWCRQRYPSWRWWVVFFFFRGFCVESFQFCFICLRKFHIC